MKKTNDKEIFQFFGISKKTYYNYQKIDNPKHNLYLAMHAFWENKEKMKRNNKKT